MPIGAFRLNSLAKATAAVVNSITATGGTLNYIASGSSIYKLHTFTTTGNNSFTVSTTTGTPTADILLVGGGGAGGGTTTTTGAGGGGGGGAVVYQTGVSISAQTYTISVGINGTGVSGADGNAGSATTGLGYTANGGGGGTVNSAATNGGGSGANSTTSYTSTAGTYSYKGGNSFGSSTAANRAGGGGAGAGGAGVNAASATGGNGGAGTQNNIDGNNYYYGSGGGGSGATIGQAYNRNGSLQTSTSFGVGRNTSGNGYSVTSTSSQYGAGGGGALTSASLATIGGAGRQGISMIRYPVSQDTIAFVSSVINTNSTSITIPTVLDNDIAVLFTCADSSTTTAPTAISPSNWTSVVNSSNTTTSGLRIQAFWKVLTAAESGTSLTTLSGTGGQAAVLVIYRGTKAFTVGTASVNQQATSNAPTNQTLTMTGSTGPYIGFAFGYASTFATVSSTTTETNSIGGVTYKLSTFEANDSSLSFATSTISMTDGGINGLCSFRLTLS